MKIAVNIARKTSELDVDYGSSNGLGRAQIYFWSAIFLFLFYLVLPLFFAHVSIMGESFLQEFKRHGIITRYVLYTLAYGIVWWPLVIWGWFSLRTKTSELSRRNLQHVLYEHNLLTRGNGDRTTLVDARTPANGSVASSL